MEKWAKTIWFLTWIIIAFPLRGSHLRGGEITYIQTNSLTFEIIVTLYLADDTPALSNQGVIDFGDGLGPFNLDSLTRSQGQEMCSDKVPGNRVTLNRFNVSHTYSGSGTYDISYTEHSRNAGVLNMENPQGTLFHLQAQIAVDPLAGLNSSPVFSHIPIFYAQSSEKYSFDLSGIDPEGDSLSYEFAIPQQGRDLEVQQYRYPGDPGFGEGEQTLTLNVITGLLDWDSPAAKGEFIFAIQINEWRRLNASWIRIGRTIRDFEISVQSGHNQRSRFTVPEDVCVTGSEALFYALEVTNPDGDSLLVKALGEPFQLEDAPAQFFFDPLSGRYMFHWDISPVHERQRPYVIHWSLTEYPRDLDFRDPEEQVSVQHKTTLIAFACLNFESLLCHPRDMCRFVVTGIEQPGQGEVIAYPNPTSGIVEVSLRKPSGSVRSVQVLNLNGQVMADVQASTPDFMRVDLSALAYGTYLLRINTNQGPVIKMVLLWP